MSVFATYLLGKLAYIFFALVSLVMMVISIRQKKNTWATLFGAFLLFSLFVILGLI